MYFDSPVLAWLILGILFVALPAILFFSLAATRLVRIQSGCVAMLVFLALAVGASAAVSSFLNSGGAPYVAEVADKKELLEYHLDGTWDRITALLVRYKPADSDLTLTELLNVSQDRFDAARRGDFVKIRSLRLSGLFHLTRLQDQSVYTQLWDWLFTQTFLLIAAGGVLGVLALKIVYRARFNILLFAAGLSLICAWWATDVLLPLWRQSVIRTNSLNTQNATVREVHTPTISGGFRAWFRRGLFSPYQVILADMIPLGRTQPIMSVDVIDSGSMKVKAGDVISVQYSPGDDRFIIARDAEHTHFWKNAAVESFFSLLALAAVCALAFFSRGEALETRSGKRRRRRRRSSGSAGRRVSDRV